MTDTDPTEPRTGPATVNLDGAAVLAGDVRDAALLANVRPVRRFEGLGADAFLGDGAFADRRTVEVAGATLRFQRAVIATGSRAAHPPIESLAAAGYLSNETVFNLTERPRRLLVVGGGPLGCELARWLA